jgi:predicted phage-related endonuclease
MRDWGNSGSDDLPVHYMAQVMWGLGVTRRTHGLLAALFGADELRTYPVEGDPETIAAMRDRAVTFWTDHVLANVAPPPTTLNDLDGLFPTDSDRLPVLADEALSADVLRLRAINAEIKAREAEAEAIEFRVKAAMRDATEIQMPNGKTAATWKERNGSRLDETALKKAEPAIAKRYARKWAKRVFALKPFSLEGLQS